MVCAAYLNGYGAQWTNLELYPKDTAIVTKVKIISPNSIYLELTKESIMVPRIHTVDETVFDSMRDMTYSVKGKNEVIKEVLMRGLKTGISQMVLNENYNAKKLLNKRSNEWLKTLFSSQEIRDLQHFIVYMVDNLVSTAKRFPV